MIKQLLTYIYLKRNKAKKYIGKIADLSDKWIYVYFNDKDMLKIFPAVEIKSGSYRRGAMVNIFVHNRTAFLWGNAE